MEIYSIEWHEDCLKNMIESKKRYLLNLQQAEEDFKKICNDINFLKNQIHEAKKKGKNKFNPEKFLKKRSKK